MSDQNAKGKSKYESPILVPLGEMAKGSGACTMGSAYAGTCFYNPGNMGPYGAVVCAAVGNSPVDMCTVGNNATKLGASYCSAGNTASDYCSAGNCAPGPTGYCTSSGLEAGAACTAGNTGL